MQLKTFPERETKLSVKITSRHATDVWWKNEHGTGVLIMCYFISVLDSNFKTKQVLFFDVVVFVLLCLFCFVLFLKNMNNWYTTAFLHMYSNHFFLIFMRRVFNCCKTQMLAKTTEMQYWIMMGLTVPLWTRLFCPCYDEAPWSHAQWAASAMWMDVNSITGVVTHFYSKQHRGQTPIPDAVCALGSEASLRGGKASAGK